MEQEQTQILHKNTKKVIASAMPSEITEEYREAMEMHNEAMMYHSNAVKSVLNCGKVLKAIRDEKRYLAMGHESYEDYIEKRVSFGKRQAYNYTFAYEKYGSTFLEEHATFSLMKLIELAAVPDTQRADFIENNDINNLSTKKLHDIIAELNKQNDLKAEQISLLTSEIENVEETNTDNSSLIDQINEERTQLEAELAALKAKPIDVAVAEVSEADIEKIKVQTEASIKAEYEASRKQELKDATEKATINAQKEMDKKIEEVKADAEKQAVQKIQSALSEAEADKAQMLEQTKKLSKELALTSDSDMVKISVLFGNAKENLIKLLSAIEEINDNEKKKSLLGKIKNWMETSVLPTIESNVEEV